MQITDQLAAPTGHFHVEVYRSGDLIEVVDQPNLVVASSRQILAALLGGLGDPITRFGVGSNGSTPVLGNTTLTGLFTTSIGDIDYPAIGQVRFAFGLSGSEANGTVISEFGLLTASNSLFARTVRASPLEKTADISFTGLWTITFQA